MVCDDDWFVLHKDQRIILNKCPQLLQEMINILSQFWAYRRSRRGEGHWAGGRGGGEWERWGLVGEVGDGGRGGGEWKRWGLVGEVGDGRRGGGRWGLVEEVWLVGEVGAGGRDGVYW